MLELQMKSWKLDAAVIPAENSHFAPIVLEATAYRVEVRQDRNMDS